MNDGIIGREVGGGRYKVFERLGAGGMANVYKAYDCHLDREVAIKVIRREVFAPDEMEMLLKRFEREAKSVARLSHPNIVGVIDYGEFEGAPYLVMEYLSGGTLKDRLGAPIPWRNAIQMILPIARALKYVHDRNIINRDIKPSNVLLTENGEPMLTDFGLVKIFGDKEKETTSITSSGTGLGTPDYMAPEQWTGEATARSDLYSLGVVLYEMITGHRPYVADTPAGVLIKQASEPLPLPTSYIPSLPKDIESVLLKALAKDPVNRYEDMEFLISELENLLTGRTVTVSGIKTEKLREQMTGVVKKKTAAVTPASQPTISAAPRRGKWIMPAFFLTGGGILILLLGAVGCWLLYANQGLFSTVIPAPAPTQETLPSATALLPSPTTILPTAKETDPPTSIPTETPLPTGTFLPTEPPLAEEIKDSKYVPMRLIPAGEFVMGSDDTTDADLKPAHTVYLEAFYIDKYEVTNERYAACVYAGVCRKTRNPGSVTRSTYYSNPVFANYPVLYADWNMAVAYCAWRGARLPTEAEWEKAARGTEHFLYPWGDNKPDCSYANISGCVGDTTAVDQYEKSQSPFGVYGLAGNVWEWTSSLYKPFPYDATDGREDLTAAGKRVARGGSWHTFGGREANPRTDTRFELDSIYYGAYVGFRCARSIDQAQSTP